MNAEMAKDLRLWKMIGLVIVSVSFCLSGFRLQRVWKLLDAPGLSGGDSRWVLSGVKAVIGDATALRGGVSRLLPPPIGALVEQLA